MTQAKEIFNKYEIGKFMMGDISGKAKVIAAIQDAFEQGFSDGNSRDTQNQYVIKHYENALAAKEKELQELREKVKDAYNDGSKDAGLLSVGLNKYTSAEDYYTKNFTNEFKVQKDTASS